MNVRRALLVDYKNRFIWLDGEITSGIAYRFTRMLNKLNKLKCFPIVFYIRGAGGNPHAAFQMMNEIQNSDSPVAIIAHDFVRSACFTITQAGKHRLALAGTKFTFHRAIPAFATPQSMPYGDQDELVEHLEKLRLIDAVQLGWFSKRGRSAKEIFQLFMQNKRINLKKATALKLIDDYYKREDFVRDRRIVRKMLKAMK